MTFLPSPVKATTTKPPSEETLSARRRKRLNSLLARAELDGARWQFWVSTFAVLMLAVLFATISKWNAAFVYQLATFAFFVVTNLVNYILVLRGTRPLWVGFLIGTINIAFLAYIIVAPNPFAPSALPPAMGLRQSGFKYLVILVCLGGLSLSPRLATWLGITAALVWALVVGWILLQPGTIFLSGAADSLSLDERLRLYFDPHFVDVVNEATNIVVILIVGGIVASIVARTRNLADDYTRAERARANLARHFSPNMVDVLAQDDEPFGPVRRQEVAVLFADIVGFTNYSEDHQPEIVFEMLREFHRRMEQVVFEHGGTVDNYIGDCIMATFGVPTPTPSDASRALACALAMQAAVETWNASRKSVGFDPVDVRIGCQFGPVVLGAIGSERNLSVAVVGDTCNVASRLQSMCRELDARICVGTALVAHIDPAAGDDILAGLSHVGERQLRGRDAPVDVWVLPRR